MELEILIKQLLDSKIIENQALAVTLLSSSEVSNEEKEKYIDEFVREYTEGKVDFFSEERKDLFRVWVELYSKRIRNDVKNRVRKIE